SGLKAGLLNVSVAAILAIARNVSVQFGAPNREPGRLYNTEYRNAIDLTNRTYYVEVTTAPNVSGTTLSNLDRSEGRP
ncbi:linear amide C-N hydrolase, partial [Rhizobium ruizarguesonis]